MSLSDYFNVLTGRGRGEGWIEVRYRHGGGMRTRFYPVASRRASLERLIVRVGRRTDLYVGCALRSRQKGDRQSIGEAWAVWAECDTPEAAAALQDFAVAPSLVIASGTPGHVHAYWALEAPIGADLVEQTNRRIARCLGADPVCYDAARILRPPGTFNHKREPAGRVRTMDSRGELCRVADLDQYLPVLADHAAGSQAPRGASDDLLLGIPPAEYIARLTHQQVGRDHKIRCPFHEDRTPSLHAYSTPERGWYCFGCGRGGSIFDFAAHLWNVDTRGADFTELRNRLDAEFH